MSAVGAELTFTPSAFSHPHVLVVYRLDLAANGRLGTDLVAALPR